MRLGDRFLVNCCITSPLGCRELLGKKLNWVSGGDGG